MFAGCAVFAHRQVFASSRNIDKDVEALTGDDSATQAMTCR
jgi:hypothetical protein